MAKKLKPIPIPEGVTVRLDGNQLLCKGKLDELVLNLPPKVAVRINDGVIQVDGIGADSRKFVGLARALIVNHLKGVSEGFTKILEVRGMGMRAQKTKDGIQFLLGYSHPIDYHPPKGITIDLNTVPNPDDPKTQITEVIIKGANKELVGEIAAKLRRYRTPDPYHGMGIRYKGEYVRKKAGKRAVATQQ